MKILALIILVVITLGAPVSAARPVGGGKPSSTPVGNDVSWPQCGKSLPSTHAFGIVGVNGGLATTTNSCLKDQLLWASRASGSVVSQPKVQLYVNTANPGGLGTPSWPNSNVDPAGNVAPNPHGECDNSDSLACAWQYGWNRAVQDVIERFQPAAQAAGQSTDPTAYTWWLDVETENTWKTGSTFAYQSNVADLEGMTAYFQSRGAKVGIYSTNYQWGQIVSNQVQTDSNLNELDSWLAGARNLKDAQNRCKTATSLTAGGKVTLYQYVANNLDYDFSCI